MGILSHGIDKGNVYNILALGKGPFTKPKDGNILNNDKLEIQEFAIIEYMYYKWV